MRWPHGAGGLATKWRYVASKVRGVASANLRLGSRERCGGDVQTPTRIRGDRIGGSRLCSSGPILSERDMQVLETVEGRGMVKQELLRRSKLAEIIVRIYQ